MLLAAMCQISYAKKEANGWKPLMDGKSFDGWKINESPESWEIEDGVFKAVGERSHIFYVGDDKPFKNFEFKVDVMTTPGSNGGVYFHTKYQNDGWPKAGFEAQVNATHKDPKKTGSVYAVKNVMNTAPHKDNEWFEYTIRVEGKKVTLSIDGKVVTEYVEPAGTKAGKKFDRVVDKGTFAFQAHDPKSIVYFKNARVKRLP